MAVKQHHPSRQRHGIPLTTTLEPETSHAEVQVRVLGESEKKVDQSEVVSSNAQEFHAEFCVSCRECTMFVESDPE